jgi:hypothetical protein
VDTIERTPKGYRGKLLTKIIAALREQRPLPTVGLRYEFGPDGYTAHLATRPGYVPWLPARPFDLADVRLTTISVMSNMGRDRFYLRGVKKTIGNGTDLTWNASDRWTSAAIAAEKYIYLKAERAGSTVTINMAATCPDGDDDTEIYPLWYLPWASSAVTKSGIVDLRFLYSLSGMG